MKKPTWYPGKKLKDGSIYVGMAYDQKRKQFYRFSLSPTGFASMDWHEAMKITYLPTREELSMIYGCLPPEIRMTDGWYWSSTEYNNGGAWIQRFSDGYQGTNGKNGSSEVRCVRRFNYSTI